MDYTMQLGDWVITDVAEVIRKKGDIMNKKWNEKTKLEKSVTIISLLA